MSDYASSAIRHVAFSRNEDNLPIKKQWEIRVHVPMEHIQSSDSRSANVVKLQKHTGQEWFLKRGLDVPAIGSSLKTCADKNDLIRGRKIHEYIKKNKLEQNIFLRNWLMFMYGKCGAIEYAVELFQKTQFKNCFSWNIMLSIYADHGRFKEAIQLFEQMPKRNVVSWTTMVKTYAQNGNLTEALELFHKMPERNVVSWNAMLAAYVEHGRLKDAINLFEQMPGRDIISWNSMIAGHGQYGDLQDAIGLFEQMPSRDLFSWNTMITAYAQHKHIREAHKLFLRMSERNVVSWNSLIAGYVQCDMLKDAKMLFEEMPRRDLVSWNTMLAGYALNGQLDNALELFHEMPHKDVVSYTALMAAYGECGHIKELIQVFQEMKMEGIKPNKTTYITMLNACASQSALIEGRWVHKCVIDDGLASEIVLGNALIDMYGKSGGLDDAYAVFEKMHNRNVVSWNAIIAAYAQHGLGEDAEQYFHKMQAEGCIPDEVTIVNILHAYVHVDLMDEGSHCLVSMNKEFRVLPRLEHYTCRVDHHGRLGQLDVAEDLIISMPLQADVTLWTTLFQSCKLHDDMDRAKRVARHIIEIAPSNAGTYVSLANLYAILR